ncbi:adenine phosphoribosyltransferase [bacterium]|nr:adenine phosphoribosyltransferase [bacterium]
MNTEFIEAKEKIREVVDFPRPGIRYKDITPILRDGRLFSRLVDRLVKQFYERRVDYIVSPESRGFILGSAMALKLGAGFVPVRRKSKLPFKTVKIDYNSGYVDSSRGDNTLYMHEDAFVSGSRILIVDDILSTGETINACRVLSETIGGNVVGAAVMVDLNSKMDRSKTLNGLSVTSCINF